MNRLISFHTTGANPAYYSSNAIVGKKLQLHELRTYEEYVSACSSAGCNCYNEETFNEYLDEEKILISLRFLKGNFKAFEIILYDNEIVYDTFKDKKELDCFTIKASLYTKIMSYEDKWDCKLERLISLKEVTSKHYKMEISYEDIELIFNAGYHKAKDQLGTLDFKRYMEKHHNISLTYKK